MTLLKPAVDNLALLRATAAAAEPRPARLVCDKGFESDLLSDWLQLCRETQLDYPTARTAPGCRCRTAVRFGGT